MKFSMIGVVGLGLVVASALADDKAAPKGAEAELKDARQKASYTLGLISGKTWKAQGAEIDVDLFLLGLREGLGGNPARLTDQEMRDALAAFQAEVTARQAKERERFFAENKKKPGVVSLASGVQYKVLKEGTGKSPKPTDTVTVDYEGRLANGTVFDSSAMHPAQPGTFQVGSVIPGFSEALQAMKVGSSWEIYIPPEQGYRERPQGAIPPNSILIFKVELKSIQESPR